MRMPLGLVSALTVASCIAVTSLSTVAPAAAVPIAPTDPASAGCSDVSVASSLIPSGPKTDSVYGQFCDVGTSDTLQILVAGATYDHTYWNFPGFGGKYSYSDYANGAGYSTLAIDQLGVGRSSKAPGITVTALSHANAIHDVVQAARNGELGRQWNNVVLVGHSFGTLAALIEASVFDDVDGIVASGASHVPGPLAIAGVVGSVRIAEQDPLTTDAVPPGDIGYLSTVDLRATEFHDPADSDPAVVAADEANRQAGTAGMFLTIPAYIPATLNIRVPVLLANGTRDRVFCAQGDGLSLTDCASADALYRSEKPFYPNADVEAYVLPGAGHSMNLALNSRDFFARATEWISAHVG